ncbi:MAG: DUF1512 domain-containing protein [Candidatus Nanohaloarchaeota archaeon]|nr:DUF1512 domain-containing protein [Candidatus Nanohaloarchaeota archaeon]
MSDALFFGDSVWSMLLFILFFFLYPRIYMMQIIWKLESDLKEIEYYYLAAKKVFLKKVKLKSAKYKEAVNNFLEFVIAFPVDIEPTNLVKKIEHILNRYESRFEYFIEKVSSVKNKEELKNLKFTLISATGLYQIFKILRHYIITIKKTNNLQLALLLQMTMPMLTKIAKANMRATEAFANGIPIGDGIGPIIAAKLKTKEGKEIAKEVVISKEKFKNREIYVMKAKGPGAALGKLGDAVEKAIKQYKINHIITVDAAAKLEGEKTGSVAQGVGVMMGGIGVERHKIEDLAVKYNIPLDGVIVKMSPEEASIHMKPEIYKAADKAIKQLEDLMSLADKKERILIIGVGNTCGVGNKKRDLAETEKILKKTWKRIKKDKEWEDYFEKDTVKKKKWVFR